MKNVFFIILAFSLLCGCSKQVRNPDESSLAKEIKQDYTSYNEDITNLVLVLNKAMLSNSNLCNIIKADAMKKFDGDVDVLLSDLLNETIQCKTKSGDNKITIKSYLSSFYPQTKTASEENDIIDELQKKYPLLQIAIPVKADDWDGSYVPTIAYVPYPFDETNTEEIPAITSDGEWTTLSAKTEPEEPVIVISQNERISIRPGIKDSLLTKELVAPSTPTNVKAEVVNDYIELSWDSVTCDMYEIYRKDPDNDNFTFLGSATSPFYNDKSLSANCVYYYYVIASNIQTIMVDGLYQLQIASSEASEYVRAQAPSIPEPLSYFNVICQGENIEFRWNDDGIPDSKVNICSKYAATQSDYSLLSSPLSSKTNWQYECPVKGTKVVYQARRQHNVGQSNPVYDFIYPPYRNTANISPVYIKKISVSNINDIEAWYSGAPEFYIKVFKPSINSNGEYVTSDLGIEKRFAFESRDSSSQSFSDALLYEWLVGEDFSWNDAIALYVIEGDNDFDSDFSAGISVPIKDIVNLSLSYKACSKVNSTFSTSGQYCGSSMLYYFENPESNLSFTSYGLNIEVSENK